MNVVFEAPVHIIKLRVNCRVRHALLAPILIDKVPCHVRLVRLEKPRLVVILNAGLAPGTRFHLSELPPALIVHST